MGSLKSRLQSFEKSIDAKFPEDYREFILNGDKESIVNKLYDFKNAYGDEDTSDIREVYTFEDGHDNVAAAYDWELGMENIIKKMIPIAGDSGDNLICISLRRFSYGKIYFSDHEIAGKKGLSKIAGSFTEFLNMLRNEE